MEVQGKGDKECWKRQRYRIRIKGEKREDMRVRERSEHGKGK